MSLDLSQLLRVHRLRCECKPPVIHEEVEGMRDTTRCVKCSGWFTLRVGTQDELDRLIKEFPPSV